MKLAPASNALPTGVAAPIIPNTTGRCLSGKARAILVTHTASGKSKSMIKAEWCSQARISKVSDTDASTRYSIPSSAKAETKTFTALWLRDITRALIPINAA
ncbi:MAG: hypothetical protein DMG92_14115 [Acidobacteria bacterium]|nr:MAG: hypothetical protein DMG92_14115 [Acidobacteriota bacterium]